METLAALAHTQQRTVIATIHQPRSSIYQTFDEIVLMVRGHVVFQGSPSASIRFFEEQGYSIPGEVNPVDFMLDVLTIDGRSEIEDPAQQAKQQQEQQQQGSVTGAAGSAELEDPDDDAAKKAALVARRERAGLARVRRLKRAFDAQQKERPPVERLTTVERSDRTPIPLGSADAAALAAAADATATAPSQPLSLMGARAPTQVALLVRRTFLSLLRDRNFLGAQLISNLFVALMLGFLFYNLPDTAAGVRSRVAATYMISTLNYYLQMICEQSHTAHACRRGSSASDTRGASASVSVAHELRFVFRSSSPSECVSSQIRFHLQIQYRFTHRRPRAGRRHVLRFQFRRLDAAVLLAIPSAVQSAVHVRGVLPDRAED